MNPLQPRCKQKHWNTGRVATVLQPTLQAAATPMQRFSGTPRFAGTSLQRSLQQGAPETPLKGGLGPTHHPKGTKP